VRVPHRRAPQIAGESHVYNNSAFSLIPLAAEAAGLAPYRKGIEFPNPDFAALVRACGGHGFRASKPGELDAEINEALTVDGPAIVDTVVAADEIPNLPHIEMETLTQTLCVGKD